MSFRPTRIAVIREELMALTRNTFQAIVLNHFLYWTKRCYDFDAMLQEENRRRQKSFQSPVNLEPSQGWIRKSLAALADETMVLSSQDSFKCFVGALVDRGWIEKRIDQEDLGDTMPQYRVNLPQLSKDLNALGYALPGFILELAPSEAGVTLPQEGPFKGWSDDRAPSHLSPEKKETPSLEDFIKEPLVIPAGLAVGMSQERTMKTSRGAEVCLPQHPGVGFPEENQQGRLLSDHTAQETQGSQDASHEHTALFANDTSKASFSPEERVFRSYLFESMQHDAYDFWMKNVRLEARQREIILRVPEGLTKETLEGRYGESTKAACWAAYAHNNLKILEHRRSRR